DGPALDQERRRCVDLVQQRLQDARLGAARHDLQPERQDSENGTGPGALRQKRVARLDQISGTPRAWSSGEMAEQTALRKIDLGASGAGEGVSGFGAAVVICCASRRASS